LSGFVRSLLESREGVAGSDLGAQADNAVIYDKQNKHRRSLISREKS
jgi:hypothetical protein